MRIQATRIEQLDRKFPGLRQAVDLLLDGGATLDGVQALVKERTGETVPNQTLSAYKQKRWLIARLRLKDLKETFQAVKEELGANAISESTQARLLELIDQAMRAGAALNPHFLLKEQRLWAVHTANLEKIETEKKRLELQIEQSRQALKEATDEAKEKASSGEQLTAADIDRIRERALGLPPKQEAVPMSLGHRNFPRNPELKTADVPMPDADKLLAEMSEEERQRRSR